MRIAVLDKELCKPKKCSHECKKVCPVNRKGEECIKITDRAVIDENLCIGCSLCVKKCPFKAISVVNLPEKLKENPVHRFGVNGFALFRLPIPVKGVVGLIGANGVGKTIALRILSGNLIPNLGKIRDEEIPEALEKSKKVPDFNSDTWKELMRIQRGTELQDYLERLSKKEIRTAYKEQQVNLLSKIIKGRVREGIDPELIKKLDLKDCLDKRLTELSGGELQRVAIARTMSQRADIYYFDEPSSFLDVKQRLNVAKAIRELSEKGNVIVVEHDLATLDFLADRIHILYGEPGVFGVVSKPYSTRNGINTFLSGYISEDTVKIREPTVFEEVTTGKISSEELISFSNIHKKYGGFELDIKKGNICKDEILGIFGSNALGKTTFARILAGEVPFNGSISRRIKISYKPQFLKSEFSGSVRELLSTIKNEKSVLFNKLKLEKLLEKNVSDLSGGELQRVAIALCLSRECDLYLLDEPSAYMDIDQRLAIAKLIRNYNAIVIDHDLLFLSYLADRAMLFFGEPGRKGFAQCMSLHDGFNEFLKSVGITFRRDQETKRPRANKPDSVKDREQKEKGEYFYS